VGELIQIYEFNSVNAAWNQNRLETRPRPFHWYFPKKIEDKDQYPPFLNWENTILEVYPERVVIHWDVFAADDALWVKIRRCVRDNCAGDCITLSHNKEYKYLHRYSSEENGVTKSRAYRSKVEHGYHAFYFETAADAVAFALTFAHVVSDIEDRHPDRRDIPEEEIADAIANPIGIFEEW
jgi:hypothetical protein